MHAYSQTNIDFSIAAAVEVKRRGTTLRAVSDLLSDCAFFPSPFINIPVTFLIIVAYFIIYSQFSFGTERVRPFVSAARAKYAFGQTKVNEIIT